jgi:hypothetical protein
MLSWLKRLRNRTDAQTPSASAPAPTPVIAPDAPSAGLVSAPVAANGAAAPPLSISHDKVAARAYEIWVRKGKPHGQDEKNWTEAEAELRAEFATRSPEHPPRKSR